MEPNIPVGSAAGVASGMKRAVAGAEREQREGASGKWVAHWKMVHIVRPVWEKAGEDNQLGRAFPPLTYTHADADGLMLLEPAPRTVRGARDLLSVALQYGNAFGQGLQAAALKPADFFGNDDVLYLMEDMATGEIRLSILWEWLHKDATLTADDAETGVEAGDTFHAGAVRAAARRGVRRSCCSASNRDVHDDSKDTTLPDRARDRRDLRHRADQGAVVHRSAEHQSQQRASRRGARGASRCTWTRSARMERGSRGIWTSEPMSGDP